MASGKVCLLCSLIILSTFIGSTQSVSCCFRYARHRLSHTKLLGYTIQTINTACDIHAVIFHIPGRFVCANPSFHWTKRAMAYVDNKRRSEAPEKKVKAKA